MNTITRKLSSIDKLTKALEATNKKFKSDDRFWNLQVDKAGNGFAIIRFLDAAPCDGDDGVPFIQLWEHSFEAPGGWYIEKSLTTLGLQDPVSDYNTKLWKTNIKENQDKARANKRKLHYVSNILVIKDTINPENNGKVFLMKYGVKVFEMLRSKFAPSEEQKKAAELEGVELVKFNPFDLYEGANFNLRARKVEGYRNYDTSTFAEKQTPVAASTEEIDKIAASCYSLKDIVDPKNFKSYEELEKKFLKVMGINQAPTAPVAESSRRVNGDSVVNDNDPTVDATETPPFDVDSDDDNLSLFDGIANGS